MKWPDFCETAPLLFAYISRPDKKNTSYRKAVSGRVSQLVSGGLGICRI